jgi:hypothetical protein
MKRDHLQRVREICKALPESTEKLSHGEPTFFVGKKVFVIFANNHHNDGRIAVWLPVPAGMQQIMIDNAPEICFKPPYVGTRGWIGIVLDGISDEDLADHIATAWQLIAPQKLIRAHKTKND